MSARSHLTALTHLSNVRAPEERRALWRQSMATLAQAALEQQPVPLEGIDPDALLGAVKSAFEDGLVNDLDWLSAPAAAAAVYELASAIPMGQERRQLGRQVLTRLYEGDAATFVVLATSLAAESRRTLTGGPIRARVALALALPVGAAVPADALALALLSRPDLRREWLTDPSTGSLPSRRLAARLLELAARASMRRAAQGDTGSLRLFDTPAVQAAWQTLLADRESLVWRHVAVARGILSGVKPSLAAEIENHLEPTLSPTEWRRASVSLVASLAARPEDATERCHRLLRDETLRSDPGLAGTMLFGMARAAEVEPEAAEELLNKLVRVGGFEGAEALVELRRERLGGDFGRDAAHYARENLARWLRSTKQTDAGRVGLCEALIEELTPRAEREPMLRDHLDDALWAFAEKDARHAFAEAQRVFQRALSELDTLEAAATDEAGLRAGFHAMRALDVSLLETATLCDLLMIGSARTGAAATAPLGDVFQRMTQWLLRVEGSPIESASSVEHVTLRMRRMRTLLHLVDADGSYGDDVTGQRRERRLTIARTLFERTREDAASPLRRIVCAALARACDALMRDEICELSDVMVAVADNLSEAQDLATLSEASMIGDLQRAAAGYERLVLATEGARAGGRDARTALDALEDLAQGLPWASTLRVSALRQSLLKLARELEALAASRSLSEVAAHEGRRLSSLESTVQSLAQLTVGARRRLIAQPQRTAPDSGHAISVLELAIEHQIKHESGELADALNGVSSTLTEELPKAIADVASLVLGRACQMAVYDMGGANDSFVPPAPKEAPLPPWLPGRRILGGFYVLRALGTGGVGSVFVVKRAEERHDEEAVKFALKVPNYNAEAARTLSEEEFLTLFREEAGALLALPHQPNLAQFVTFDAGAKPKPILVMELVEGPTLERVIERGELGLAQALRILDGIAAGLCTMHDVGIGHLDVKPSNVILRTPDMGLEEHLTPVLVDFGLAGRQIRPGCATGPYGGPEIWGLLPDGFVPEPRAADVYAFSCLAYEVLTGDTLFDGPGELNIINAHLAHDGYPEKLLALRQNQRLAAVCDLIANGLRQHPGERIGIHEMREAFAELSPGLSRLAWPLRVTAAA